MAFRTSMERELQTRFALDMSDLDLGDYDALDAIDADRERRARLAAGLAGSDRPVRRLG